MNNNSLASGNHLELVAAKLMADQSFLRSLGNEATRLRIEKLIPDVLRNAVEITRTFLLSGLAPPNVDIEQHLANSIRLCYGVDPNKPTKEEVDEIGRSILGPAYTGTNLTVGSIVRSGQVVINGGNANAEAFVKALNLKR